MLIVVEHIEAGACWGEKNDLPGPAQAVSHFNGISHGRGSVQRSGIFKGRGYFVRRGAEEDNLIAALPDKWREGREITPLVLAAQNDDQSSGKGLE